MKQSFCRILGLILALVLCLAVLPAAGAEEAAMASAEAASADVTAALGEPRSHPGAGTNSLDIVNSRMVFVNKENGVPVSIMLTIRVSDSLAYVWQVDYSEENLDKAMVCFSEKAPVNVFAIHENDDIPEMTMALFGGMKGYTYEKFTEEKEQIRAKLTGKAGSSSGSSEAGSRAAGGSPFEADSILAEFRGIQWGQSRKDFENLFGADTFLTNKESDSVEGSSSMSAVKSINGEMVPFLFMFREEKLYMVMALVGTGKTDPYTAEYTEAYGQPAHVSYVNALIGKLDEDPQGDCLLWKAGSTAIVVSPTGLGITYIQIK